jgi:hypothetical protein
MGPTGRSREVHHGLRHLRRSWHALTNGCFIAAAAAEHTKQELARSAKSYVLLGPGSIRLYMLGGWP